MCLFTYTPSAPGERARAGARPPLTVFVFSVRMSVAPLYQVMMGCGLDPRAVQVRSSMSPARTEPVAAGPVMVAETGLTVTRKWKI